MDGEKIIMLGGSSNAKGNRTARSVPQMSDLNPYTLLSSDILGALLTHITLKTKNYDQ